MLKATKKKTDIRQKNSINYPFKLKIFINKKAPNILDAFCFFNEAVCLSKRRTGKCQKQHQSV